MDSVCARTLSISSWRVLRVDRYEPSLDEADFAHVDPDWPSDERCCPVVTQTDNDDWIITGTFSIKMMNLSHQTDGPSGSNIPLRIIYAQIPTALPFLSFKASVKPMSEDSVFEALAHARR